MSRILSVTLPASPMTFLATRCSQHGAKFISVTAVMSSRQRPLHSKPRQLAQ